VKTVLSQATPSAAFAGQQFVAPVPSSHETAASAPASSEAPFADSGQMPTSWFTTAQLH
jgi:hypothetical protein